MKNAQMLLRTTTLMNLFQSLFKPFKTEMKRNIHLHKILCMDFATNTTQRGIERERKHLYTYKI